MTHITRNLVAVKVPENARDFIQEGSQVVSYMTGRKELNITFLTGSWKFQGVIAESAFMKHRDCSLCIIEIAEIPYLMQSAGCYFENPLGEKPTVYDDPHSQYGGSQMDDLARWEKAQSQSSPKWAILEKL